MSDIAHLLNASFLGLIALYVCLQTALTIAQVRSAEHAADKLPAAFRASVPLVLHRKAADYTGETAQADLVNAYLGALICLVLTLGNGFNLLAAGTMAVFGAGLFSQFTMCLTVLIVLAVIDFPLAWWKEFRINERYGYEKMRSGTWIRRKLIDSTAGLLVEAPILLGALYILDIASYAWWMFAFFVSVVWLAWRLFIRTDWIAGYAPDVTPMADGPDKTRLMRFVAKLGLPTAEICVSPKPAGWRLGNAYFCRRPLYPRRLVIFEDAVRQLKGDELLAVVACAAGRINRWHKPVRFLFFTAFSLLFWWGFSLLAVWPDFYAMMNIEPSLAVVHGSVNPGLLLLITLTVVPIALYPLVLFVHAFTRLLDYDEDEYAVQTVGSKPFIRALVKLHRDYRNTLTPSRFFSLANHIRPHVTQRITEAFIDEQKIKRAQQTARRTAEGDMAGRFAAVMADRRRRRDERNARLWRLRSLELTERRALLHRTQSFNPLPGAAVKGNR